MKEAINLAFVSLDPLCMRGCISCGCKGASGKVKEEYHTISWLKL